MLRDSFKKSYFFSIMFLFLLAFQNPIIAKIDASKFGVGFNAVDATAALQGAIDSKADTILVPYMGADWIVKPIFLRSSNQTIVFENKVVVTAKKGEFHGGQDCLFSTRKAVNSASYSGNITLIGYGATFRMQKADYLTAAYGWNPEDQWSPEWRCCIYLLQTSGIKILGLTLKQSGGDGISMDYGVSNVLIKDVICDDNFRQGMSPCDNRNLTIENCIMINTCGAPKGPWGGVDFEPYLTNSLGEQNVKMINCYTANNYGGGIIAALATPLAAPVDIQIKNCFSSDAISDYGSNANEVKGTVSYEDCILEGLKPNGWDGVTPNNFGYYCRSKSGINTYLTKLTNLVFQNCNPAIGFITYGAKVIGGLQFVNCEINEPDYQPTITRWASAPVTNISGNLTVYGPNGANSQLGSGSTVTLQIKEVKTKPPVLASVKPDKGISAVTYLSATIPARVLPYTVGNPIDISAVAYDPDNGTTNGAGITKVDFALWRSTNAVAAPVVSYSDLSAPYAWPITIAKSCPRGVYLLRITAYSSDGSKTVAVIPFNIFNTIDGSGPYVTGTGIELNPEAFNGVSEKDFLIRNTSQGFMVFSPFATDSRMMISDLSGRQVTLAETVKGRSWNNIGAKNKLSNSIYFVQTTEGKGNNSIVKKAMITK
jgi:hypothetical protein